MRLKLKAADLIRALDIVSNVTPRPITPQGGAGHLFKAYKDADGTPRCHIYSKDQSEVVRGSLMLIELDEEGTFISPLKFLDGIRYLPDDEIDLTVTSDGDNFAISYKATSGASAEGSTFNPKLITPIDKDFEAASKTTSFPAGTLREAMSLSKKFLADVKDTRAEEHLKTLQIFDASNEAWAKGNGHMFATNGTKAFFFYCEAFEDNGIAVHGAHLDRLAAFLGKCDGTVEIRHGERMMFAVNTIKDSSGNIEGDHVFGWAYHTKTHQKFSYYPHKLEKFVLRVTKLTFLNALHYMRTQLDPNRDKIRIHYKRVEATDSERQLFFTVTDSNKKAGSFPVTVIDAQCAEDQDFEYNLNIDHLLELVEGVKGNEVLFRVAPVPPDDRRPKGAAMFRTIDEFWISPEGKVVGGSSTERDAEGNEKRPPNGLKCRVTRFMPSKD